MGTEVGEGQRLGIVGCYGRGGRCQHRLAVSLSRGEGTRSHREVGRNRSLDAAMPDNGGDWLVGMTFSSRGRSPG